MHFLFGGHFINLHNLFSQLHIVWRKLMLGMGNFMVYIIAR